MSSALDLEDQIGRLQKQISAAEIQLSSLKAQLHRAEQQLETSQRQGAGERHQLPLRLGKTSQIGLQWPLIGEEYTRYGRQLILPEVGLPGQLRLKNAKVLVVGVGGLGCPAAAYLAGAGVGTLGLVDGDTVEVSNLHRQIAHGTSRVGQPKVDSAYECLRDLNPLVHYERHPSHLSPQTALALFSRYDLVLDCTDHPTSRYLISDACILAGKPLISASALRTEGQLIVLNHPPRPPGDPSGGPCYRCVFPRPPPADSVLSCGEGGILGPVVGTMGVLQALEAVKLLVAPVAPISGTAGTEELPPKPTLLMFSALSHPPFRSIRMRARHKSCAACSASATISPESLTSGSLDYVAFCGARSPLPASPEPTPHVTPAEYVQRSADAVPHTLIDVRDPTQFGLCALPGAVNVPWTGNGESWVRAAEAAGVLSSDGRLRERYVVCRLGNDSQLAVRAVREKEELNGLKILDFRGGLRAWREEVDESWPDY